MRNENINLTIEPFGPINGEYYRTPYRYAFNNPIRYADPDGLLEIDEIMSIFNNASSGKSSYDSDGNCTCGCEGKPPCPEENEALVPGAEYAAGAKAVEEIGKQVVKKGGGLLGRVLGAVGLLFMPANGMEDNGSSHFSHDDQQRLNELAYKESQGTLTDQEKRELWSLRYEFDRGGSATDFVGFRRDHILNRHRSGAGKPGKTEFPADWSDEKIIYVVNKIANDPHAVQGVGKWDSPYKIGVVEGIEIRVDFYPSAHPHHSGKVSTAYPTNVPPNPN